MLQWRKGSNRRSNSIRIQVYSLRFNANYLHLVIEALANHYSENPFVKTSKHLAEG